MKTFLKNTILTPSLLGRGLGERLLFLLFFYSTFAFAIPAKPGLIEYTQPDGTVVKIQLLGDERHHIVLSEDGFFLASREGAYYYADIDNQGQTVLSPYMARPVELRSADEQAFLSSVDMSRVLELKTAERTKQSQRRTPKVGLQDDASFPTTGSPRVLVILAEYKDRKFQLGTRAYDYFNNMLNQEGFSEYNATGSALDYFRDASCGQFTPQFDVYGPVTLSRNMSYYGSNIAAMTDQYAYKMITEACEILDPEVDFSVYDCDGDGFVDNVYLFYAGLGEAQSGNENTVWPHSYNITEWEPDTQDMVDGVQLDRYATSNEWIGSGFTGRPDGIGTFVHEFTHVLGLPDLYSTVYNQAFTPGKWSVLDAGPYLNDSRTPPTYAAFERNALGWMTPTEINQAMTATLPPIQQNAAFVIETDDPDEFFLLENRQQEGWDAYIPHHGMLIWHIQYDAYIWRMNQANNTPSHQFIDIEEADGIGDRETITGDCYPGTAGITSFTADTRPAMKTWANRKLDYPITDIAETAEGLITFNVLGGGDPVIAGQTDGIDAPSLPHLRLSTYGGRITASSPCRVFTLSGQQLGVTPLSASPGTYIVLPAEGGPVKAVVR